MIMSAADVPHFMLNNGTRVPAVGLGCWMGEPGGGERAYAMVKKALLVGYRHFDTAAGYQNEEEVGRAIRDSGVLREEIFITTKLGNGKHHDVQNAFDASLEALGSQYIDLYLMHWPQANRDGKTLQPDENPTFVDTWLAMEALLASGKVRAIGVSNFGVPLLRQLAADPRVKIVPATNQVELHPCLPLASLRAYAKENRIVLTAYSPIGQPQPGTPSPLFEDATLVRVAEAKGATPAQVALSWGVQHGIIVIPKTENEGRMKANIALVKLDEQDMRAVDGVHTQDGKHRSLLGYHSETPDRPGVFGWSYKQMGWEVGKDGGVVGK